MSFVSYEEILSCVVVSMKPLNGWRMGHHDVSIFNLTWLSLHNIEAIQVRDKKNTKKSSGFLFPVVHTRFELAQWPRVSLPETPGAWAHMVVPSYEIELAGPARRTWIENHPALVNGQLSLRASWVASFGKLVDVFRIGDERSKEVTDIDSVTAANSGKWCTFKYWIPNSNSTMGG